MASIKPDVKKLIKCGFFVQEEEHPVTVCKKHGKIICTLSKVYYHRVIYTVMPFDLKNTDATY